MPRLARALGDRGHSVTVLTFGDQRRPEPSDVRLVAVPRSVLPLRYAAFFLRALSLARDADLLFACEHPRAFSLLAARLRRKPVVVRVMVDTAWEMANRLGLTRDEPEAFDRRRHGALIRLLQRSERRALTAAAHVVAVSRHLAAQVERWGVDPERLTVCYNLPGSAHGAAPAEDPAKRRATARRELGLATDRFHLLIVSRLIAWKRIDTAFDALVDLPDDCHLTLLGDGSQRAALERRIERLGLADRVDLVGAVDQGTVSRYMAATDLLLLPSLYEGLSHVVVEAMQVGLAVAASDAPGNRELIHHGETGVLFSRGDSAAIRHAVERLRANPAERTAIAGRAQRHVERLRRQHHIERLVDLLESVGGKRQS